MADRPRRSQRLNRAPGKERSRFRQGAERFHGGAIRGRTIAERAALLSGRDDEFVATIAKGYTGIRWGELVGLETRHVRPKAVRVEWQLYELDTGELHRCPPKDGSRRTVDVPGWLAGLLSQHIARTGPTVRSCHGLVYAFSGHGLANAPPGSRVRSSSTSPAGPVFRPGRCPRC